MRVFIIILLTVFLTEFQLPAARAQEDVGYTYSEPTPAPVEEPSSPPPSEDSYAAPVIEDYSPPQDYHSDGSESGDF